MTAVASLFDGIGGTPLAARLSGAECLWCSEIEKFPQMVTKHHFPSMKHYGDITKINGAKVEPVDIIVGGSPCQDLSVAGKRQGMKHSDFGDEETTRSGLFMEQIRIVKEMRNATETNQPRFMVWENVPGAFSSNKGEDFRAVLEETAKIKDKTISIPRPVGDKWANAGCIMGDGFSIAWRTYDAQYWGVAQRRRRIYLVADFGGQSAPEILFECPCVSGDIAESGNEGQGTSDGARDSITTAGGKRVTATITATYGTKWNGNSGADTGDHFILDKKAWQGTAEDVERSADITVICSATQQGGAERLENLCPTLTARMGTGGNQVNAVCSSSLNSSVFREGSFGSYVEGEFGTLKKSGGALSGGSESFIYQPIKEKTVRRLTPLECERLQGYPDGWTDIPPQKDVVADELKFWRGVWDEWDDIQCQKHHSDKQIISWLQSESADTARYKALGNSFAIPNILFVIQRCVEVMRCEK